MHDDTRAVAKLPSLEIEIRHRKAPDEGAEYLSVSLRATPDLTAATAWLDPFAVARAWVAFNPWLALWGLPAGRLLPGGRFRPAPARERER
jgi:hypothetical protein